MITEIAKELKPGDGSPHSVVIHRLNKNQNKTKGKNSVNINMEVE